MGTIRFISGTFYQTVVRKISVAFCNTGQNSWQKVKKSGKIEQNKETLISTFP